MRKIIGALFATLFVVSLTGAAVACPYSSTDKSTEKTESSSTS